MDFQKQYQGYQKLAESALATCISLPRVPWPEQGMPLILSEAMRYSLLSGGKRLRPVLLLAAYHTIQEDLEPVLPFAAAIELIHTYSLIHDDLPAMDNDDLRRGRPTSHKVFGEAIAILAGDAMLTFAFELMSKSSLTNALQAIYTISSRAGASGMIAGQAADIVLSNQQPGQELVSYIHLHKTADLITAPVLVGLQLAQAGVDSQKAGLIYGQSLGLAFQITDDLLDLQGDPSLTGKSGQRDQELGKITWPSVVGVNQAKKDVEKAINDAFSAAGSLGRNAAFFQALALSIPERVK